MTRPESAAGLHDAVPAASASAALLEYLERSKHRLRAYAPGPGGLDWANQPDPFRTFEGAPRVRLPLAADTLATRYGDVRAGNLPPPAPLELTQVAILFELAFGLSAWKSFGGNRWALRCNPSSGNLHPTEAYLLCAAAPGLPGGLYHYVSRDHAFERRAEAAGLAGGFLVGISSIHWREAWKYGMRAWRYCQHDCRHAVAAAASADPALGWGQVGQRARGKGEVDHHHDHQDRERGDRLGRIEAALDRHRARA